MEDLIQKAYKLFEEKKYFEAVECYSICIQKDTGNSELYEFRAECYYFLNELEFCLEDISMAINLDPDKPINYYNRSLAFKGLEMYNDAIADLKIYIELMPNGAIGYLKLGQIYKFIDDFNKALESFDKGIKISNDDYKKVDFMYEKSEIFASRNEFEKTIEMIEDAEIDQSFRLFRIDYIDYKLYMIKAHAYRDLKKHSLAISFFRKAFNCDKKQCRPLYEIAWILNRLDKYYSALKIIDKAIELSPERTMCLDLKVYILMNLEKYNDAKEFLMQNQKNISEVTYAYSMGVFCKKEKKFEDAIVLLMEAIDLGHNSANARFHLGYCLNSVGNFSEAETYLDEYIEMDDTYGPAFCERGYSKYKLERYDGAIEDFNVAVTFPDLRGFGYFYKGLCLLKMNDKVFGLVNLLKSKKNKFENADKIIKKENLLFLN